MNLAFFGLITSYLMALFLFCIAYREAIYISGQEGKVYGGTMIGSLVMAVVFTRFACLLYEF